MAHSIAKSGLFGVKDADQALALMFEAQAENKHPAAFMRDNVIISFERKDGTMVHQRAKKAEAMERDFIANGGKIQWHKMTDEIAEATFSHPAGGTIKIDWTIARAKQAGLVGRPGDMYAKFPRAMLRSRCVSEGCRAVGPFATGGVYTPEEVRDMEIDITPGNIDGAVQRTVEAANALTEAERMEHFDAMDNAKTTDALQAAFGAAWSHAKAAHDPNCQETFRQTYERRKGEIEAVALAGMKT
jgi:hypothetical protein